MKGGSLGVRARMQLLADLRRRFVLGAGLRRRCVLGAIDNEVEYAQKARRITACFPLSVQPRWGGGGPWGFLLSQPPSSCPSRLMERIEKMYATKRGDLDRLWSHVASRLS